MTEKRGRGRDAKASRSRGSQDISDRQQRRSRIMWQDNDAAFSPAIAWQASSRRAQDQIQILPRASAPAGQWPRREVCLGTIWRLYKSTGSAGALVYMVYGIEHYRGRSR